MIEVILADSREALPEMAADSLDACVCDPPYGLKFMGRGWDAPDNIAFYPAFWREVYRVLKPGAHLVAFGGTRTYHRLVCAIEDAGFEVRDQLAWVFGSGFPKSHDIGKAIDRAAGAEREVVGKGAAGLANGATRDSGAHSVGYRTEFNITAPATDAARAWQGWGTALKPAWEPICLARKPLIGTVAANVLKHGTGAINVDACRVGSEERFNESASSNEIYGQFKGAETQGRACTGRWPANLVHDGSEEVVGAFPEADGAVSNGSKTGAGLAGSKTFAIHARPQMPGRGDSGSAARFFYTAKADADDRLGSKHPTVKPVDLMAWLVKLVTPPGGTVLDPFAGSGTTGMACMREGFNAVLIEREAEYVADIKRRLAHVKGEDAPLFMAAQ